MPEEVIKDDKTPQQPKSGETPSQPSPNDQPKDKPGSIYEKVGLDDPGKGGSNVWPEDWRSQLAAGDAATAKFFERYDSPIALAKGFVSARQMISSGEYKRQTQAPDPAKDAEGYAKWREDNGLPVKAEEYAILTDGVKLEELDDEAKGHLATFQKTFHDSNLTQAQAKTVSKAIFDLASTQIAEQAQADAKAMDTTEDTLRADWGHEYRDNLAMNGSHVTKVFGEEIGAAFWEARMPDGRKIGNIPEISKAINAWARSEGGDILVAGGEGAAKTVDVRIAEIEKVMSENYGKYAGDPKMKEEYRELLAKREARLSR